MISGTWYLPFPLTPPKVEGSALELVRMGFLPMENLDLFSGKTKIFWFVNVAMVPHGSPSLSAWCSHCPVETGRLGHTASPKMHSSLSSR